MSEKKHNIRDLQKKLDDLQKVLMKSESNPVWESMTVNTFEYHLNRYERCEKNGHYGAAKKYLSTLIKLLQGKILRDHCE